MNREKYGKRTMNPKIDFGSALLLMAGISTDMKIYICAFAEYPIYDSGSPTDAAATMDGALGERPENRQCVF